MHKPLSKSLGRQSRLWKQNLFADPLTVFRWDMVPGDINTLNSSQLIIMQVVICRLVHLFNWSIERSRTSYRSSSLTKNDWHATFNSLDSMLVYTDSITKRHREGLYLIDHFIIATSLVDRCVFVTPCYSMILINKCHRAWHLLAEKHSFVRVLWYRTTVWTGEDDSQPNGILSACSSILSGILHMTAGHWSNIGDIQ